MSSGSDVQVPTFAWSTVSCTCGAGRDCRCGARTDSIAVARDDVTAAFLAHREAVYRYLVYRGWPAIDAEDITQEAFLRLFRARVKGQRLGSDTVLPWVITVARRLAIDRLRHQRVEQPLFQALSSNLAETLPDNGQSCEEDLQRRQRRAALMRALEELTPLQRECLHLRSQGLSLRDASAIVGVPFRSVSRAVQRAIRRLRRHIDDLA